MHTTLKGLGVLTHLCIVHWVPELIIDDHSEGGCQVDAHRPSLGADQIHLQAPAHSCWDTVCPAAPLTGKQCGRTGKQAAWVMTDWGADCESRRTDNGPVSNPPRDGARR